MRLFSFVPSPGERIRVGAFSPHDRVVDLGAEARRRNIPLSFDPGDMLSLIAAGEKSLTEARSLVDGGRPGCPRSGPDRPGLTGG